MSIPLSQKVRSLGASTYMAPSATVHHSPAIPIPVHHSPVIPVPVHHSPVPVHHSPAIPVPVPVEVRVPSAGIKKSAVQFDGTLRDIKRRYEDEARHVQQNYEVDYNNQLSLIKAVEELEVLLDEERRRNADLENKYNGATIELERERRLRMDFEHDCAVLRDEIRRAEAIISDNELKISRLQQDVSHLDSENKGLRNEIHRLTDLYNIKIRDIEERYGLELRDLTIEVERLRNALEQQRIDYENRLKTLDRDWSVKHARLQEVLLDKERLVAELESELLRLTDHINHLKMEYEEELRRQVILVREEEHHKYQVALKNLEVRLHQAESERELLARKNQELVRELHVKERQIQDLRMHFESEAARLKAEIHDLRNQVAVLNDANGKLRSEVATRDNTIARLESEIINLEREMDRLNEIHVQEINRLVNDHLNERRRWEDAERVLQARIAELERIVRALESENVKLRADIERIKEQVTGNVHRSIFQTFVDYDASNIKY